MQKLISLLFLMFLLRRPIAAVEEPTDLCNVKSLVNLAGRHVTIKARLGFTSHGMFLLTDQCSHRIPSAVVLNPDDPGAPIVPFEADKNVMERLRPFLKLTGGAAVACGMISGEFAYKKDFKKQHFGGGPQGNGFGPRGAFRFAFVLQSVIEISACS
jgi:hypothetical protein